jgi:hypothetical protein
MTTAQMTGPSFTFAAFSATVAAVMAGVVAAAVLGC